MNIIQNSTIKINDIKYKYKIFNTDGLIDIIRHKKKFSDLFEDIPNLEIINYT